MAFKTNWNCIGYVVSSTFFLGYYVVRFYFDAAEPMANTASSMTRHQQIRYFLFLNGQVRLAVWSMHHGAHRRVFLPCPVQLIVKPSFFFDKISGHILMNDTGYQSLIRDAFLCGDDLHLV